MANIRYTLLLDDTAASNVERLRRTYGLKTKADVYDLATAVLTWLTEQRVTGHEVGRFRNEVFQPLLIPHQIDASAFESKPKTERNDHGKGS